MGWFNIKMHIIYKNSNCIAISANYFANLSKLFTVKNKFINEFFDLQKIFLLSKASLVSGNLLFTCCFVSSQCRADRFVSKRPAEQCYMMREEISIFCWLRRFSLVGISMSTSSLTMINFYSTFDGKTFMTDALPLEEVWRYFKQKISQIKCWEKCVFEVESFFFYPEIIRSLIATKKKSLKKI